MGFGLFRPFFKVFFTRFCKHECFLIDLYLFFTFFLETSSRVFLLEMSQIHEGVINFNLLALLSKVLKGSRRQYPIQYRADHDVSHFPSGVATKRVSS